MNETIRIIEERYSCRDFSNEMLSDEILETIAKAGVASPSAMNLQPWRVIVIKDAALINEIESSAMKSLEETDRAAFMRINMRGGKLFYNAPSMVIIPIDSAHLPTAYLDCGIVCQNITLAAEALELGTLICGLARFAFIGEDSAKLEALLGFPDGFKFGIAVLLGYPSEQFAKGAKPHDPDLGKIIYR